MARLARLTVPEVTHHVVVQGINRESIFIDNADRVAWLGFLQAHALTTHVRVHAYVMLRDHIQILVTPEPDGDVSRMMQGIGRQYVSAFNRKHGRTGTLWDGRYRCSLVQSDQHLLRSMAFMDLTPVRLGEVGAVGSHIWGSYGHYTGSQPETWLYTPAPVWRWVIPRLRARRPTKLWLTAAFPLLRQPILRIMCGVAGRWETQLSLRVLRRPRSVGWKKRDLGAPKKCA